MQIQSCNSKSLSYDGNPPSDQPILNFLTMKQSALLTRQSLVSDYMMRIIGVTGCIKLGSVTETRTQPKSI